MSARWSTLPGTMLRCFLSVCALVHPPWNYIRIMFDCLRGGPLSLALYRDVVCLHARWSTLPGTKLGCCLSVSALVHPPWHYIEMLSVCQRVGPPSLAQNLDFVCLSARWSNLPGTILRCRLSVSVLVHLPWHYIIMMSVCLRVGQPSLALYWMLFVCLRVGQPSLALY